MFTRILLLKYCLSLEKLEQCNALQLIVYRYQIKFFDHNNNNMVPIFSSVELHHFIVKFFSLFRNSFQPNFSSSVKKTTFISKIFGFSRRKKELTDNRPICFGYPSFRFFIRSIKSSKVFVNRGLYFFSSPTVVNKKP